MSDLPDVSMPRVVLAGLTLSIVIALLVAASTSSAVYGPYNEEWDGTSQLRSIAKTTDTRTDIAVTTDAYSSVPADATVAFVISPNSTYRPRSAARVSRFVRNGGTLVVAADNGRYANRLLRSIGANARIDGRLLRDVRSNYLSSAMPVATEVTSHPLIAGLESLTLNYGTAVYPGGATPLINTSEFSYFDADQDGEINLNQSLETRTVATVERLGDGRVVVVGDASAFINAMVERPGNHELVRLLLAQHSYLLLDNSHTGSLQSLILALVIVRDSAVLQFALGAVAIVGTAVWSWRRELPDTLGVLESVSPGTEVRNDNVQASESELAAYLEREHTDWDRDQVERVASAIARRRNR